MTLIAPSILSSDFAYLADEIKKMWDTNVLLLERYLDLAYYHADSVR